jgi:dihydrofolate synthase/folylpolyglutamate synthase
VTQLQDTLETLYGLERRRSRLSLDGTLELMRVLGVPQRAFRAVHVAGTNGKGSVCALVESVLRAAGIRTGLYTSPHLVDFRERVRIAGRWASEELLEGTLERVRERTRVEDHTFFEVATALAFDAFAREKIEWAVVEVGLGGRLDCTNVITPEACAITAIGLDHTEVLGETIEAIAREKAGIVKRGVPVVVAARRAEAEVVIRETARAMEAPSIEVADRVRVDAAALHRDGIEITVEAPPWGTLALRAALRGRHQLENLLTALATLSVVAEREPRITSAAVIRGFASARWPGRLEPSPTTPRLWWDGAHNDEGLSATARAWREDLGLEPPAAIVLALSRDKNASKMLEILSGLAPDARLHVTRTRNLRAMPVDDLAARARESGRNVRIEADVPAAVEHALALSGEGTVLLVGSLFAVGEAMERFGGAPGESW